MNVSTLISEVSRTRKLLQVAAYHSTALPSVQLSDERFKSAKPFLKQLFRAFGKQGFEILISTWGEIYAFSVVRELGIKIQVTEEALGEKLTMGNFNEGDLEYRIFNIPAAISTGCCFCDVFFFYNVYVFIFGIVPTIKRFKVWPR